MECSYKNRPPWKNISKENICRHVFVIYVLMYPLSKFGRYRTTSLWVLAFYSVRFKWKKLIWENSAKYVNQTGMVAHRYHSILPHVNWNACDILLSNEISFLVYHLISSFILNRNWIFISVVILNAFCKLILKNINIFRANYNHEIHIFLKVNIKLVINKKYEYNYPFWV